MPSRANKASVVSAERCTQLLTQGRMEEAVVLARQLVDHSPQNPLAQEAFGEACFQDGRLEVAAIAFEKSAQLKSSARVHLRLGDVRAALGDRDSAEQSVRAALSLAPCFGQAWLRLSHLHRYRSSEETEFSALQKLVSTERLAEEDREAAHFALAKAYDDLGQNAEAFEHWRLANQLHKRRLPYNLEALQQLADRLVQVCEERLFERCRGWGLDSQLPVFIVGMPRTGSTLVEQILASHPQAYGVGELRKLARLTADLPARLGTRRPFPECLQQVDRDSVRALGAEYLRRLTRDAPSDVVRISDKMLSHILLVGLLGIVFPNARVLHCKRSLLDAGLSMYQHSFSGSGVGYAYDLEDIGKYHQLCVRVLAHWKRVTRLKIVDIEYEGLVSDPQTGVRGLLEAVELPWDARCLESHVAKRQVTTVSEWQVRQPLHKDSVGRWKKYAQQLEPLRKYLDPGEEEAFQG